MKKMVKASALSFAMVMAVGAVPAMAQDEEIVAAEGGVFAETPASSANEGIMLISAEAEYQNKYTTFAGTIESVEDGQNSTIITVKNEDDTIRFPLSSAALIYDRESGEQTAVDKLAEGMSVSVVYDAMAPVGLSMPAYNTGAVAVVINGGDGSTVVGYFNDELLCEDASLVLNIGETTQIQHINGTKKLFTADDVKGQEALVFYDVTTRSIPAQTNPSFVLVLTDNHADETEETDTKSVPAYVGLREAAEEKGYTVEWNSEARSITVSKEDYVLAFTLDAAEYTVNGESAVADMPAISVDGRTQVSEDVAELL